MSTIALAASLIIALACYAIAGMVTRGLIRSGRLWRNRRATATAAIFFSYGVGHGIYTVYLLDGGSAAWQFVIWDAVTAIVALIFGTLLMLDDVARRRLEQQLAADRTELAEAQALAQVGSWSIDVETLRVTRSEEFLRIFDVSSEQADAGMDWNRIDPADRARVRSAVKRVVEDGEPMDDDYRVRTARGERVVHARGHRETHPATGALRAVGTVQDITESYRLHERLRVAFEQAGVAMTIVGLEGDDYGSVLAANQAYAELLGDGLDELVGQSVTAHIHPDDLHGSFVAPLSRLAKKEVDRVQFERRYLHRDGHVIWTLVTNATFTDEEGRSVAIGQILDISERKRFEAQLQYFADHDALTGLVNRRRFHEQLSQLLAHARRCGAGGAVLALDLDGLKFVNDALGHAAGDDLVAGLAGTLRRSLRETDIVGRMGGDEFAIALPLADERAARLVAEKLLGDIRRAGSVVDGQRHSHVTASIGVTTYTAGDDLTAEDLLVEADIAMYDAKAEGKDRLAMFRREARRRERIVLREDWLATLRRAIAEERFALHAQPIVPVCSSGVPRFELLLRLPDDHGDFIPPGTFLHDAERFGLVEQIDRWVMAQAVRLLHEHHAAGNEIALSVNMSARTLNGGSVAGHVASLLDRHPIPDSRFVIEVTETAAISNIDQARELARELHALGCRLALDDFGAGFATLFYLTRLDFDYVKIDGEFIKRLPTAHADQLVVRAVVDIARGLGSDTIAEFVQDDETMVLLRELGVGYAQGYHTGRPGPLGDVLPALTAARPAGGPSTSDIVLLREQRDG